MQDEEIGKLVPQRAVAAELGCCVRTILARVETDPEFPRPIIINTRRFYSAAQVSEYKQRLLARAMSGANQ